MSAVASEHGFGWALEWAQHTACPFPFPFVAASAATTTSAAPPPAEKRHTFPMLFFDPLGPAASQPAAAAAPGVVTGPAAGAATAAGTASSETAVEVGPTRMPVLRALVLLCPDLALLAAIFPHNSDMVGICEETGEENRDSRLRVAHIKQPPFLAG
ncbi:hypothetical protein PAPYR_9335 [Paratrimastix pyriformis]|uniref:Uncharacterized protein n=1 Tax=Paratrimastix pyriformis TaxID=342808 RepID=A0ABQ8U8Q3_9EUKA|nr:hypothetical protein PAPYR_9335 [Paratrimastix pyriformis]